LHTACIAEKIPFAMINWRAKGPCSIRVGMQSSGPNSSTPSLVATPIPKEIYQDASTEYTPLYEMRLWDIGTKEYDNEVCLPRRLAVL
jgi:hypothetical protein